MYAKSLFFNVSKVNSERAKRQSLLLARLCLFIECGKIVNNSILEVYIFNQGYD